MRFSAALLGLCLLLKVLSADSFFATEPQLGAPFASRSSPLQRLAQRLAPSSHKQVQRIQLSKGSSDDEGTSLQTDLSELLEDSTRNVSFSALMALCGAILGPFLDSYHSAFGVLQYDNPIYVQLWGSELKPALITAWWVPELFGLAGFIIGWLYILLDHVLQNENRKLSPPLILIGIAMFTGQYWLSGVLSATDFSRTFILNVMSTVAAIGFYLLDGTLSGFLTSAATALGGPLIEVGLLYFLQQYHYTDSGEFGFFPLWIAPVYFFGGPANGNLARGFWKLLSTEYNADKTMEERPPAGCKVCNDSRCVACPNCDGQGYYVTYNREVKCNACKSRGLVICRSCFSYYGEDPADIESIREIMSRMPD